MVGLVQFINKLNDYLFFLTFENLFHKFIDPIYLVFDQIFIIQKR